VEVALAADLQKSALAHVVVSLCGNYTGQFNMFVAWCEELVEPRASLPASDATVALYLYGSGDERREDVCADEDRVRRDRLLL